MNRHGSPSSSLRRASALPAGAPSRTAPRAAQAPAPLRRRELPVPARLPVRSRGPLAAAEKDNEAPEFPQLGHGAMTYTLLEGLNGAAANGAGIAQTLDLMAARALMQGELQIVLPDGPQAKGGDNRNAPRRRPDRRHRGGCRIEGDAHPRLDPCGRWHRRAQCPAETGALRRRGATRSSCGRW